MVFVKIMPKLYQDFEARIRSFFGKYGTMILWEEMFTFIAFFEDFILHIYKYKYN